MGQATTPFPVPPLTGKLEDVQILPGLQVPPGGASVGSHVPCGLTAVTDTLCKATALACRRHWGLFFVSRLYYGQKSAQQRAAGSCLRQYF